MRETFIKEMRQETLELQIDEIEEYVYIKIHAPLKRLCEQADRCALEMPLLGVGQNTIFAKSIREKFLSVFMLNLSCFEQELHTSSVVLKYPLHFHELS